jgi:hypothetical protein
VQRSVNKQLQQFYTAVQGLFMYTPYPSLG